MIAAVLSGLLLAAGVSAVPPPAAPVVPADVPHVHVHDHVHVHAPPKSPWALDKTQKIIYGSSAVMVAPFVGALIDEARTRTMNWTTPTRGEVFTAGKTYQLRTENYGLASRMHLRTVDLFLLNERLDKALPFSIGTAPEHTVLKNVMRSWDQPTDSVAKMNWSVPATVPTGIYRIMYRSQWSLMSGGNVFESISPPFEIVNVSSV